ncbi:MAG: GNAT family N-acetyltransferase [Alphaproteobacteria bacterium]|nr:GNAT family N-acetyltransferase [Alphaproteobacteria bacterium]
MLMRYKPYATLDIEILDMTQMRDIVQEWDDLCRRAIEDNVYFTSHYALSLLDTVATRDKVLFVTVREGDRLVGMLPVVSSLVSIPSLKAAGRAWSTDYTFSATPLLDRSCAMDAAAALVEGLRRIRAGEWIIPTVNVEAPSGRALIDALDLCGIPWNARTTFERASISADISYEDLMNDRVGSKRRRELARSRRRLEELGEVCHEWQTSGQGLARAVESFLNLEASGWKGERGTALACTPATRAFALRAFAEAGSSNRCRADLLLLNGRPIAAGIIVLSGRTGFTVKGAYDEAYAKFSVGLLLELEVLKSFLSEGWAERLDAATAGAHVIDRLWPDRVKVADIVLSLSSIAPNARLNSYTRVMDGRATAKRWAKQLLGR